MSFIDVWPDTEGAIRDYLRGVPEVAADVGTRVFFGVAEGTFPQVVVSRVGATSDLSDAPIDQALIQLDVWGPDRDKATATRVKNRVKGAITALNHRPVVVGGVQLAGATVDSDAWLPDPNTQQARYILTCTVVALVP